MSNPKIMEVMQTLSNGNAGKTATARLNNIFDGIELAMNSGVKREVIWAALREIDGYDMPLNTFESAIYRIRKNRGDLKKHNVAVRTQRSKGKTHVPDEASATKTGFHQVLEQLAEQNQNEDPRRNT